MDVEGEKEGSGEGKHEDGGEEAPSHSFFLGENGPHCISQISFAIIKKVTLKRSITAQTNRAFFF